MFELETPEADQMSGGKYLSEPGFYHFLVDEVRDGEGPKGGAIDGFGVQLSVLAGDHKGEKIDLTFWKPKMSASEKSQNMDRRKNTAFAIATNLFNPNELGKKVEIDLQAAGGQQIIAEVAKQTNADGEESDKFLQLHYASVYHVDDPEVAKLPKNADMLAFLEPEQRRSEEFFAYKAKARKPAPAKPEAPKADPNKWDDI